MPSYEIERVGELEQELVLGYDAVLASDESLVAAIRTQNSYLKVAQYRLETSGGITHLGDDRTVQAADVSVTAPIANQWVTAAVKTIGGKLLVSQWRPIAHQFDGEGSSAVNSAIASFGTLFTLIFPPSNPPPPPGTLVASPKGYLVATAHANAQHQLRVTAWLSPQPVGGVNEVAELASAVSGRATKLCIVAGETSLSGGELRSANVITASISSGMLRLVSWRIDVEPQETPTVQVLGETTTAEAITEVSAATFNRQSGPYLATAVITASGNLKVLTWKIETDGTFTHWKDAEAGAASDIDCARVRRGDLVVGCRDGGNKLKLIYWRFPYAESGSQEVIRLGSAAGGTLGDFGIVKVCHTTSTASVAGDTVVACRTQAGKLKLIRYRVTAVA